MKEYKAEGLINKYKEGQTTLSEEQVLFNSTDNLEPSLEAWSAFVKNNKTELPKDFNAQLWESFENRKSKKRKLFVGVLSAAASVIVLMSLFLGNPKQEALNYAEKEALLSLAKKMVSNSDVVETEERIIYENDIVIIYTTKEE
ncbi:hypothetical protein [uncultured Winogradskyella sp.]|uniref:hypothetical protein n=1 Tax=uncultured Winogradskyella sp. TaxID=395353 RepID=UPI00260C0693|nr:hypothetical protein [uncultured Winogradskyella sp.]